MRVELFYGLPLYEGRALFHHERCDARDRGLFLNQLNDFIEDLCLDGIEKTPMFIENYGGGNNNGATYLGISLKTIVDDYAVTAFEISDMVIEEEWKQRMALFDGWLATDAGKYFSQLLNRQAALLVVCDSD